MGIAFKVTIIAYALVVGVWDFFCRRIPNALSLAALATALTISALAGGKQLIFSLKGAALGLGLGLVPFALKILGGGDVKVLTALGSLVGTAALWEIFFYANISLGGLVLLTLLTKLVVSLYKSRNSHASSVLGEVGKFLRYGLPYSTFLAMACLFTLLKI